MARLGYLSRTAEFLVTSLVILVHALGRHTQRYSQWGSSSNADSRYQYSSHRFHRLTALIIRHALTLSFHAYNLPSLQILPTAAFLFFFSTDSTDFPDYNSDYRRLLLLLYLQ